ncbi:MAG: HAD-IC family P-type ATPase [Candidatus Methanoplasma sp.]|jgi:cation-transporting ATPase E|nr:HAD-IC family P-type ATPase [Candidatus Methanoplasma sp.]
MSGGLSDEEVRDRISSGRSNSFESPVSRRYSDILVKNACTPFNLMLFLLGAALVYFEEEVSAVSATGVIILNILIATVQEARAKRRLDKIALLIRPKVRVLRGGSVREIDPSGIVMDDSVLLSAGDQAQVDGVLIDSDSVEMDESPLTGESGTVRKAAGDTVFSGTVCVAGDGLFRVTALGADTFASRMLLSAKRFKKKKTPLQAETGAVTKMLMAAAFVFLAFMVARGLLGGTPLSGGDFAMRSVVVLDIVPIALFLLITITYMIAAVRMSGGGVLLQNSNSVESMSHVDTVCMDKTGTITTNGLAVESVEYVAGEEAARPALEAFVSATGGRNRTVEAMERAFGRSEARLIEEIRFSSERKYSAVRTEGAWSGTVFVGAWSALRGRAADDGRVSRAVAELSGRGLRSVVACVGPDAPLHEGGEPSIPRLEPVAIVSIRDEVRPDCRETIQAFLDGGMDLKVISGDDPDMVAALFKTAGIPGEREAVSGDELDAMAPREYDEAVLRAGIFGRMKPEGKERVIESLRRSGRYVAMVGDGVNDVRPIKAAQVGIALQSGSGAARGVADMVLAGDDFSALPRAISEGKRTVSGMRDILKLYLTRNFVLAIMVLLFLVILGRVPLLPVQNAYYALASVSIAAFFMAIWAKPSDNAGAVLPAVLRHAAPSAVLISAFGIATYALFSHGAGGPWAADLGEPLYRGLHEAYAPGASFERFLETMGWGPGGYGEITARSAMLLFLVLAGISQIFLICPLSRLWSADGKPCGDPKPTVLALLLFGLVALLYSVPQVAVGVASLALFPPQYYALIGGIVCAWFACSALMLRGGRMGAVTRATEKMYGKSLEKEMGKGDQGE